MDRAALDKWWSTYKSGTLWHNRGKCLGYSNANPGEAQTLDNYVLAVVAGQNPQMPVLATSTGSGLAGIVAAGLVADPQPVPIPIPPPTSPVCKTPPILSGVPKVSSKITITPGVWV